MCDPETWTEQPRVLGVLLTGKGLRFPPDYLLEQGQLRSVLGSPVLQVLEGMEELPGFASLRCAPGPINCADTAFCLTGLFWSSPAAARWAAQVRSHRAES